MEAGTAPTTTGSATIADLLSRAAALHADRTAVQYQAGDGWATATYAEVGELVSEVARGLIDLGLQPGDRACILSGTRPEWTYADFAISAAGGVVVPIYQTNSAEEVGYILEDSDARLIVCEDPEQVEKVLQVRASAPQLETLVVMAGEHEAAVGWEALRERGRARDRAELDARTAAVRPDDPYTIIYTSGTTGPPKGCVLHHTNYRSVLDMCLQLGVLGRQDPEITYLYLPLAHSYALLIQLLTVDVGGTIAYFGGDTKQIVAELVQVRPTYLPSVPRVFEKIYTLVTSSMDPETLAKAVQVGMQVQDLKVAGQPVPEALQAAYDQFDEKLFVNVRGAFGGRLVQANTGAAPIAHEILEFFWACGVPVMEGYGMTETATVATSQTVAQHRFGTVGRALPGVEIRIADDGEVLLKGANIFQGYHKNADASFGAIEDGWLHTGDLGSVDEDGFLSITGRKKDIIITAGGKNLTPANLENDLKQTRWVSQAVMHGDRRPYPVVLITLDEEEIVPWAQAQGIEDTSIAALSRHPQVLELIQAEVDRANAKYAQVEQVKRFFILDHDLSQETGELTPTLKVKRNVVNEKYADAFSALYG
ncbi:MAG: Long-chain-fatty-acid--CoA ligase [uncultured Solirubrobacteraceae bacterium]|uniref:Acyl-CoA synthetase n=1 Tax=uncultured Solirubrobacteraceae bacterium TaxID=1162706 RepID=A0A6J4S9Z3_9ACTN|nr:MAG: Long-chain-fatty-acid--CoA ligase [uncultured Solirubrobacteraceae bacterium]